MRLYNSKRPSLSKNQSAIWDAINACPGSREKISAVSGVSVTCLYSWTIGKQEPKQLYFDSVMQAIEKINTGEAKL